MRISDCSSDVCSSDLTRFHARYRCGLDSLQIDTRHHTTPGGTARAPGLHVAVRGRLRRCRDAAKPAAPGRESPRSARTPVRSGRSGRSEEHTSELQSLMRISYAVFCLKKKKKH